MKRTLDLLLVVLTAPVWLPVLGMVALHVRWRLGSPVLFRQTRPGLHAEPFVLIKFRTMRDAEPGAVPGLGEDERVTPFGRKLRRSSLDELPELWNVLKGDMSLVGPRPLLMSYLPLYNAYQARRHEVKPGITGWAQINGRNNLTWDEKFDLDIWYVENHTTWLDLRILARTVFRVLNRDDISPQGSEIMPRFTKAETADN